MPALPGLRPTLGLAGTIACRVPHGTAPTPDGEWAPRQAPGAWAAQTARPSLASLCSALSSQPTPLPHSASCPLPARTGPCGLSSLASLPGLGSSPDPCPGWCLPWEWGKFTKAPRRWWYLLNEAPEHWS